MGEFPAGLDFAWLACDAAGCVAILANAGIGPIPAAVLAARPEVDRGESLVRALPRNGGHTLHVRFPRPDDYIGWAERGLFAYDWRDTGRYEIIATPEHPVVVGQLPPEVALLAGLSVLGSLRFAESSTVETGQFNKDAEQR